MTPQVASNTIAAEDALLDVTVSKVVDLTPYIRTFTLQNSDGSELPSWSPGAHTKVIVGDGTTRSYSLIGPYGIRKQYRICVQLDKDGMGGSNWMHARKVGDSLQIYPPRNDFHIGREATLHTFIAGGIGITPLLPMIEELTQRGEAVQLYYCARGRDSAIFVDQLRAWLGEYLTEHYSGSNPLGRLDFAKLLMKREVGEHLYVCGSVSFVQAVREAASAWPREAVHFEMFATPNEIEYAIERGRPVSTEGYTVRLARTGITLHVPPGKSILRVLIENNIPIEYSCEEGTCGMCTTEVISGKIEHHDLVLTQAEKDSGDLMQVCVSRPIGDEPLVLDL